MSPLYESLGPNSAQTQRYVVEELDLGGLEAREKAREIGREFGEWQEQYLGASQAGVPDPPYAAQLDCFAKAAR